MTLNIPIPWLPNTPLTTTDVRTLPSQTPPNNTAAITGLHPLPSEHIVIIYLELTETGNLVYYHDQHAHWLLHDRIPLHQSIHPWLRTQATTLMDHHYPNHNYTLLTTNLQTPSTPDAAT